MDNYKCQSILIFTIHQVYIFKFLKKEAPPSLRPDIFHRVGETERAASGDGGCDGPSRGARNWKSSSLPVSSIDANQAPSGKAQTTRLPRCHR